MQNELYRLATFNNSMWKPAPGKPSSCCLARIGFYHCQTRDAVVCCFCQITIDCNEFGSEPELKHRHSSPTCPLACDAARSDNVPLVDPVVVIKKFQGDPSVTDASDSPSVVTEITWNNHPSFRKLFHLLKTLIENYSQKGISHINEQDAIFIQIDLENPDFDRLRYEQVRLSTFSNWPNSALVEPEPLARAGLFYSGSSDRVQCAFCRNYLRSWVRGDLPDAEHRRHYPDCPFVRGSEVGNVPIDNLSEISLPSSVKRSVISDTEQNQQQNVAARSLSTPLAPQSTVTQPQLPGAAAARSQNDSSAVATPQSTPASQHSSQLHASTSKAKHPAFASEASRVKSFEGKIIPRGQDVKVLAMAGFFHVGPHDNVKCFYCDGGLKNWQPTDDPWEEHAKWFPRCSFLMTQRDPGYIHMIQEVYRPDLMMQPNLPANIGSRGTPLGLPGNDIINEPEPPPAASAAGSTFRFTFEPREIKARMDSPSVKAVLSMGFPRELVRHAIQVKLSSTGDDFSSAQELVENVMQLQELQDKGLLGPLLPPPSSTSSFSSPLPLTTLPSSIHSSVPAVPVVSAPLPNVHPRQNPMSADLGSEAESAQSSAATSEQKPGDNTASKPVEGGAKSVKSKKRNKKRKPAKAAQGDTEAGEMDDEKETEMKQDMAASASEGAAAAAVGAGSDDADPEAKSLMEENRQLKEAKTCKVCMDEEVNVVFLPCGHLACCNNCAPALRNCPICRAFIRGTVRIFLS